MSAAKKPQYCLRCTICLISWPNKDDFKICPQCESPTLPMQARPAMSLLEAYDQKRHHDFDRFYENWDATHDPRRLVPTAEDHVRFPFRPKQAAAAS